MAKIFLSYRRQDSAGVAGRIYDRLRAHFGNDAIFMDIDSIPFGEDFREHIDAAVGQCDVVLAVIGPRWSGKTDASRRIDDSRDFVRIELESALERGIPVIPVLLDRTRMPTEAEVPSSLAKLTYRNAIDVDQGRDFHPHVDRLVKGIEFHFERAKTGAAQPLNQPKEAVPNPPVAKVQERSRNVSSLETDKSAKPGPRVESRPGAPPSTSALGQQSKQKSEDADGLRPQARATPAGVVKSEPLPRKTPVSPGRQVQSISAQLQGTPPKQRDVPWLWLYVAVVPLLALLGIVIHIITDDGTVKITGTDPNMVVRIDNKLIRIENIGEPITLRTGPHDLLVTRGELVVKTQTFQIQRGQETPLEVSYIPKSVSAKLDGIKKHDAPLSSVASDKKSATSKTKVSSPKPAELVESKKPENLSPTAAGKTKSASSTTKVPSPKLSPPQPAREWTNSIGMKMVRIDAGEFLMGTTKDQVDQLTRRFPNTKREEFDTEQPRHPVKLSRPFYLGLHEVTVGQFKRFVESSRHQTDLEEKSKGSYVWDDSTKAFARVPTIDWRNPGFTQTPDHPVVCVAFNDAVAFCAWLSQKESRTYRLPTEAEWEFACRAGTTMLYLDTDDPESLVSNANVADATLKRKLPGTVCIAGDDRYLYTAPVGSLAPNHWGLYDMLGNVKEWCADLWDEKYYVSSPTTDPLGGLDFGAIVIRGGSWNSEPWVCRPASRTRSTATIRYHHVGFRVAAVLE